MRCRASVRDGRHCRELVPSASKGLRYTIRMAHKRALVVDDSKSARVILSRMLEKYDIEVDMSESAEQAIEYLKNNRPDAIFMDHLMPGMDGLQAVQAIKSNPQTAMIPIMMYTSQEGELYVGQARALGAMGVLPKQVRPERPAWPWAAGVAAACVAAMSFAACWLVARDDLAKSRAEVAGLTSANAELQRAHLDLSQSVKDLTAALTATSGGTGA